jgi:hypothetical protein
MGRRTATMMVVALLMACGGAQRADKHAAISPTARGAVATTVSPTAPSGSLAADSPIAAFGVGPTGQPSNIHCHQWLVFTSDRRTYTDDEVKQMANFLVAGAVSQPPTTLRFVDGTVTNPKLDFGADGSCSLSLQITNVTAGTIQIPQVGWHLTDQARPNTASYALIEACSTEGTDIYCGPQRGAGPTKCDFMEADSTLDGSGTDFLVAPVGDDDNGNPCPQITLRPNQSIEVGMRVSSSAALIYPVEPEVAVVTTTGKTIVPLSRLAGTMVFADPSQYTCSRLQGRTFVATWSGADALTGGTVDGHGRWCA